MRVGCLKALGLLCVFSVLVTSPRSASAGYPGGLPEALGPEFEPRAHPPPSPPPSPVAELTSMFLRWNQIALDTTGLDHTPVKPGENRIFGEQYGPTRASRAMAIVHVAIFDAVNAIERQYQPYTKLPRFPGASMEAAVAQAAHDTLSALFPSQAGSLDAHLQQDVEELPLNGKAAGLYVGKAAAAAILALRQDDGSQAPEPRWGIDWVSSDAPGMWQKDPTGKSPLALGAHWYQVRPFVMASADQFRVKAPPALDSREYATAFDEAKRLGGDGVTTPTERTADQTITGIWWAYDGTPSLCAPPRLYNQIALHIANIMGTKGISLVRLLALVNVSMADATIAVWESKFHYDFWRPVTGIRRADEDGNPETCKDPSFTPLGAPASNLLGPNFTPPFPTYPSGHAGIGASLFQTLRNFYGTDQITFTFISDEFNGATVANNGTVRPVLPHTFSSLSEAEEENGQSRIYLGIHWRFDKTEGISQGRAVADYVFHNAFQPCASAEPHSCESRGLTREHEHAF